MDGIDTLIEYAPKSDEVEAIKGHAGPTAELAKADLFLLEMSLIPRYTQRLQCLRLKSTFRDSVTLAEQEVGLFTAGCREACPLVAFVGAS